MLEYCLILIILCIIGSVGELAHFYTHRRTHLEWRELLEEK